MMKLFFLIGLSGILFTCCTQPGTTNNTGAWQSFIPEGYTIRDSTRGELNPDSIPDFLMVLEKSVTTDTIANRRLLLLYGQPGGLFQLVASSDNIIYHERMGGVSTPEPYDGLEIMPGAFDVKHHGGMRSWQWEYVIRFQYQPADEKWYLERTKFTSYSALETEDTIPFRVAGNVEVQDSANFGKVLLSDFNIYEFEAYNEDTPVTNDHDDRKIRYNFFQQKELSLPAKGDQLDSIAALKALFPGRFFRDFEYSEDANVVFWLCDICPKVKMETQYYDQVGQPEMLAFPDGFANFTNVVGTLSYLEKNIPHKAVFFSTAGDYPGSGRFWPGVLGIAVFKKNVAEWQLLAFSPNVVAEGTFSTAHAPQKVISGENYTFFELNGGNANGAGALYRYQEKFIFGVKNHLPVMLLHEADGACIASADQPTQWATDIQVEAGETAFPDLNMITTGHYYKDTEEQELWKEISWLKKLLLQHTQKDSFEFKVIRQYRFNGGKYVIKSTRFE